MGQPARSGNRRLPHRLRAVAGACALSGVMLLAACGSSDDDQRAAGTSSSSASTPPVSWTLVLDYEPNAVHAALLRAETAGYFDDAGIDLKIVAPSSTSDALTQVGRGRADVGLADLIDVARRNDRALADVAEGQADVDTEMVSVAAAIVQRPLSGLIVDRKGPIGRPLDLAGKKIAVSGLPSDEAVVKAMVQEDGRALPTDTITLGFNGLKALSAGRVDATTAYWPADAVTYAQLGKEPRVFALDDYGGPRYPGLVAFTSRRLRTEDPQHVQGFQEALAHGIRDVVAAPSDGLAAVGASYPELDAETTKKQLDAYVPLFGTDADAATLPPANLDAFAAFAAKADLTSRVLTAEELTGTAPASEGP